jgi:hypothetical protein
MDEAKREDVRRASGQGLLSLIHVSMSHKAGGF